MQEARSSLPARVLRFALVPLPWVLSLYMLYWMESADIWVPRTSFRGGISLLILATGMGVSFAVYSMLFRSHK